MVLKRVKKERAHNPREPLQMWSLGVKPGCCQCQWKLYLCRKRIQVPPETGGGRACQGRYVTRFPLPLLLQEHKAQFTSLLRQSTTHS